MIYEIDTELIKRDMAELKRYGYDFKIALLMTILRWPPLRESLVEGWNWEAKSDKRRV